MFDLILCFFLLRSLHIMVVWLSGSWNPLLEISFIYIYKIVDIVYWHGIQVKYILLDLTL